MDVWWIWLGLILYVRCASLTGKWSIDQVDGLNGIKDDAWYRWYNIFKMDTELDESVK